jgi:hypothetical protein
MKNFLMVTSSSSPAPSSSSTGSPSATVSSWPVTVTVWGACQLSAVKTRLSGATRASLGREVASGQEDEDRCIVPPRGDENRARALDAHGGDVAAAAEALLGEAQPQPQPQPRPAVSRELATLLEFGFERASSEAALAATGGDVDAATEMLLGGGAPAPQPAPQPVARPLAVEAPVAVAHPVGALPANWELRHTPEGRPYYVDHNTRTTHWTLAAANRYRR